MVVTNKPCVRRGQGACRKAVDEHGSRGQAARAVTRVLSRPQHPCVPATRVACHVHEPRCAVELNWG